MGLKRLKSRHLPPFEPFCHGLAYSARWPILDLSSWAFHASVERNTLAVTIRELAKLAGVSKSTVAYALNNNPCISKKVRTRIQALAEEHNYQPNPLVRAFASEVRRGSSVRKRACSLAYLVSLKEGEPRTKHHAYERMILDGAKAKASALGYNLEVLNWDPANVSASRFGEILYARGIQGIFIGPGPQPNSEVPLDLSQVSAICFGYTTTVPEIHRVVPDLLTAIYSFAKTAMDRGYDTMIFAINQDADERVCHRWTSGATTLRQLHGARKVKLILDHFDNLTGRLAPVIRQSRRPAVFGNKNLMGGLLEEGIAIPEDCGFVSDYYDGEKLTAIVQPFANIGAMGVSQLATMVERAEWGVPEFPVKHVVQCGWHEGDSLPYR